MANLLRDEGHDDDDKCPYEQPGVDEDACDKQDMPEHKERHGNDMDEQIQVVLVHARRFSQASSSGKDIALRSSDTFCAMFWVLPN
jgi:hypothetical protein